MQTNYIMSMFIQFYMSPSLALIGLCVVPPVSMLAVIYGRFVRGITRQLQDSLAETSEVLHPHVLKFNATMNFLTVDCMLHKYYLIPP